MAGRVKNTASADDLKRALLLKVPKLDPAQYMHLCAEKIAASYLEFILYVLEEVTPRLTASVLEKAAMEAYKVPKGEAARFAAAICDVVKEARLKNKSFKTGEKIEANLKRICLALQEPGAGQQPSKSSKSLLPVAEEPKRKLKEVVSVASSEDGFLAMKHQSCSASAIAILEASPGKASAPASSSKAASKPNAPASSSKAASKVAVEQKELPSAAPSKTDGSDKIFLDKGQGILKKIIQSSGEVISATMKPGPAGFALAFFPGSKDGVETELPNLALEKFQNAKGLKRPAAVLKKPASAKAKAKASKKKKECTEAEGNSEGSSSELAPAAADAEQPACEHAGDESEYVSPSRTYRREYYKAGTSRKYAQLSIRQSFGKKAVVVHLSLRVLSPEEGEKIIADSLALLREGKSEEYVYSYAKGQAEAAS